MKYKAIIKRPNESAKIEYIETTLEALQDIVGGYIEYPFIQQFRENGISVIVNDEGKLLDLEPSIALNHNGRLIDFLNGNVIFIGTKETEYDIENDSLTDEQIKFLKKQVFNGFKCITTTGNILDVINI